MQVGFNRWLNVIWPFVSLALPLLLICGLTIWFGGGQSRQVVVEMMIRVVVVVGMYIFVGNSGILSFGHISFMAIGAYAAAWLTCCTLPMVKPIYLPGLPEVLKTNSFFFFGIVAAVCLTGATAFVVGFAVLRLSGIAASIATFALLAITVNVYGNWDAVTGGASSIANIPVEVGPWLSVSFAILTTLLAFLHQISRYGLMLRATRDDAIAASASGISTLRVRLVAFVLSAICVGVGGALYANFLGILSVDAFYLSTTFLALAMLVVGGVGSLAGAVIGVLFITALTELFRSLENGIPLAGSMIFQLPHGVEEVVLGGIMILVLIFRPSGLMRGREMPSPFAESF